MSVNGNITLSKINQIEGHLKSIDLSFSISLDECF
jgi:hypothetical protein